VSAPQSPIKRRSPTVFNNRYCDAARARFSSADALTCRLVDSAVGLDKVLATAVELGGKSPSSLFILRVIQRKNALIHVRTATFVSSLSRPKELEPQSISENEADALRRSVFTLLRAFVFCADGLIVVSCCVHMV